MVFLGGMVLAISSDEFDVSLGIAGGARARGNDFQFDPFAAREGIEDALTVGAGLSGEGVQGIDEVIGILFDESGVTRTH